MYNIKNEKLQEVITKEFVPDRGKPLNGCFETVDDEYILVALDTLDRLIFDAQLKESAGAGVKNAIRGTYYANGQPVDGLYTTDNSSLIIAEKDFIEKSLSSQAELKRANAVNSSLQTQIINSGKNLSEYYKASAKKEAIEKFGNEIVSEYLEKHEDEIATKYIEKHKSELIEQFRQDIEIDKDAIIQEYLETHKKTYPHLKKANQERSNECIYRTALYLSEFCSGSSQKEISKKYDVAYSTVHRLLQLNDKSDIDRLMQVYALHKELFDGFTEMDVRDCLESTLNRKMENLERRLAQAREFIAKNIKVDNGNDWGE